jgi:Flp pilus assembly protein CpaB
LSPSNIRTPLFILGVALALVAFLAMFTFGLLFANRSGSGAQIKVVVAARDIVAREPMTNDPSMVSLVSWPQSGAPAGVVTSLSEVTGTTALVNIPKGQPITTNVIALSPDQVNQSTFLPIPKGWKAMTIPTSEQQGVGGYIAQGDYIDVIATVTTGTFNPTIQHSVSVTKTVFMNVYVLRVGPQSIVPRQSQGTTGVSSSITILITECDALYFEWLLPNATLKYTLSSYQDYAKNPPQPTTICDPTTVPSLVVGPAEANAKWNFTKG